MRINGRMLASVARSAHNEMKSLGREVNADEIADIVLQHAALTAVSAAVSGGITGVGSLIASGITGTSAVAMYGRLAKAMGVKLNKGLIKALASAVAAELTAVLAVEITASAVISFVPGAGNIAASAMAGLTNYCYSYLAGFIFIKMVSALGVKRMESMDESEMKEAVKKMKSDISIKDVRKEAKASFKEAKIAKKIKEQKSVNKMGL